jgi:hypothetical protein
MPWKRGSWADRWACASVREKGGSGVICRRRAVVMGASAVLRRLVAGLESGFGTAAGVVVVTGGLTVRTLLLGCDSLARVLADRFTVLGNDIVPDPGTSGCGSGLMSLRLPAVVEVDARVVLGMFV